MGFLDNASNSIQLDAVLTDAGRSALARNDGSFNVVKFALSDDEVNYDIIAKYGRSVGREKIEKNTPVFEALTSPQYAQKYKLISVSNPNLVRLPYMSLSGDSSVDGVNGIVTLGRNSQKTSNITVEQTIQNEPSIDVELRDQVFIIEMNDLFMQISKQAPESIDAQRRATYRVLRSQSSNAFGGSIARFTASVKALTDATFAVFGSVANKNIINTYVRATGMQSGAVLEFKVSISKLL